MSYGPDLQFENELLNDAAEYVVAADEVGRGAVAGPVAVGLFVWHPLLNDPPSGIKDSKALSEKRRLLIFDKINQWHSLSSVGFASAKEIDEFGISYCLSLAAMRALHSLKLSGLDERRAVFLIDGNINWFKDIAPNLQVVTKIKADNSCLSVAAASILAKVVRDKLMIKNSYRFPGYYWESNKGYGSLKHYESIKNLGLNDFHRKSWIR